MYDILPTMSKSHIPLQIILFMMYDILPTMSKSPQLQGVFRSLFWNFNFFSHIWSIKYRLIKQLITEVVCKLRDESNELINMSLAYVYCSFTVPI